MKQTTRIKEGKAPLGRPKGSKGGVRKYRLMMMFLYGRQGWIERTGMTVRLPCIKTARHLGCSKEQLRKFLYELEAMGLCSKVRWNRDWLTAHPILPINAAEKLEIEMDIDKVSPAYLVESLLGAIDPVGAEKIVNVD